MSDHLNKRVTKLEEKVTQLERLNAPGQQLSAGIGPQGAPTASPDLGQASLSAIPQIKVTNPKHPWYQTLKGWKTVLEIIGILFAIGYATVTYCEWRDLRNNFKVEQRAWLRADFVQPPSIGNIPIIGLQIKNIGKSPAVRSQSMAVLELVKADKAPSFSFNKKHFSSITPIRFPGDTDEMPVALSGEFPILTDDQVKGLGRGEYYFAIFGVTIYKDQFGNHWTRFCSWKDYALPEFSAPNIKFNISSCILYNGVGDGDLPAQYYDQSNPNSLER